MVAIYTKRHQTWPWKKYFPFRILNMCYLTGNLCYSFVTNIQVLSYLVKNKIRVQQACVQKYVFVSTETYHAVMYTEDVHTEKKRVRCVSHCLKQIQLQNYIH